MEIDGQSHQPTTMPHNSSIVYYQLMIGPLVCGPGKKLMVYYGQQKAINETVDTTDQ